MLASCAWFLYVLLWARFVDFAHYAMVGGQLIAKFDTFMFEGKFLGT